jgi:hypothetical protein
VKVCTRSHCLNHLSSGGQMAFRTLLDDGGQLSRFQGKQAAVLILSFQATAVYECRVLEPLPCPYPMGS